jgi:hypothetical protein
MSDTKVRVVAVSGTVRPRYILVNAKKAIKLPINAIRPAIPVIIE